MGIAVLQHKNNARNLSVYRTHNTECLDKQSVTKGKMRVTLIIEVLKNISAKEVGNYTFQGSLRLLHLAAGCNVR